MKIQVALDSGTLEDNIAFLKNLKSDYDIIEIGTPLVYRYGIEAIRIMKENFPNKAILFDTKIIDAGYAESEMAFELGADFVTVLAVSNNKTISDALSAADKYSSSILVDLLGVTDIRTRCKELLELGVHYIGIHIAHDVQNEDYNISELLDELQDVVPNEMIAVAGGVNPSIAKEIAPYKPGIVIVGSALSKSLEPNKTLDEININLKRIK